MRPYLVILGEIPYFSATAGEKKTQEQFSALLQRRVAVDHVKSACDDGGLRVLTAVA